LLSLCLGFGDGGESLTLLLLLLNFFLVNSLGLGTERLLLCLISLLLGLSSFRLDHTNLILSFSSIKFSFFQSLFGNFFKNNLRYCFFIG
jgi:hypothetical protein